MRKINPNAEYVRLNNNGRLKKEYRGQIAKIQSILFNTVDLNKKGMATPKKFSIVVQNSKTGAYDSIDLLSRHAKEELSKWSLAVIWWRVKYLVSK